MINTGEFSIQNPEGFEIDFKLLQEFENGLEFEDPESSSVPCQVLGFGEISTVFEILVAQMNGLAFKRVGIFETYDEMMDYLVTYEEYNRLLEEDVGLNLPAHGYAAFINKKSRPVFYIIQQKLSVPSIGNKAMHLIPEGENIVLFDCVLHDLYKVWQFNQREADVDVGIDGQVSNWIIQDFDPAKPCIEQGARLSYVDTSTPMIRAQGEEQLDPELFLRSAPPWLAWILRILYLDEVMDRYYDFRKVVVDLLANCCKEQKPELIPDLVVLANGFFESKATSLGLEPIEEKEVLSYYEEDARIWRLYQAMRKIDRRIRKWTGREYPYPIPPDIQR